MSGLLFETPERGGNVWRLEVVFYRGQHRANLRKWWRDKEGEWRPARAGVQFPPERLSELRLAIERWEAGNALSGPENGS